MTEITEFIAQRSKHNAPILTGALRSSIGAERVVEVKQGTVVGGVEAGVLYALKLHEEPFKLGPISAKQPPTIEGGVGNKYIERVFNFYMNWIKQMWEKVVINY